MRQPIVRVLGVGLAVLSFVMLGRSDRLGLWLSGVRVVSLGESHRAYLQDFCGAYAGTLDCTCIALIASHDPGALEWKDVLHTSLESWGRPVRLYSVERLSQDALPLLEKSLETVATCKRWMVVGRAGEAWRAARLALKWRDRVNKLVLVDPDVAVHSDERESLQELRRQTMIISTFSETSETSRAQARLLAQRIHGAVFREIPKCEASDRSECARALQRALREMVQFGAM